MTLAVIDLPRPVRRAFFTWHAWRRQRALTRAARAKARLRRRLLGIHISNATNCRRLGS